MKPKVYIETSVISYLTARPSRDILVAANQQVTQDWWQDRRMNFELYISQLVCRLNNYEPPVICSPMELMEA
jgi:hypothetical protein